MPFPKWVVEPVFLSRKPLPPDKEKYACEFSFTTNVSLVNCLKQLASVAKIADRIFDEIGSECRLVSDRIERIREKINSCEEVVSQLNARAVQVPVSDLNETFRVLRSKKPYNTHYDQSTQLFLPCTRPPCIDQLYGAACVSPVAVMCTIDRYRTDGLSSSDLFMVTPVLGGTRKKKKLFDIEIRKPANFSLAISKQDAIKSGTSSLPPMLSPSVGYITKQNGNLEFECLPSPEEQAMMVSMEYPSSIVPVDTSGTSFTKMSLLRRSLIHVDFVIKRKKSKRKSKRRHTFCEGENRELDRAIRNVTNSSCQTDETLDVTSASSSTSIFKSLSKRRSRSVLDNSRRKNSLFDELDLDSLKQESKDSATEDDKENSPSKASTVKKSKISSSIRSRACNFNPISSLSAAISIAAVKMRNSSRSAASKQDDGRSSSGNWSASSSTRASVDSDHQQMASPVDGISSPSRNSVGKDSVLSDATHHDPHNRSRDDILVVQSLSNSPSKKKKFGTLNFPWSGDSGTNRHSNTPTPDFTSHGSFSTPVIRSPYAGRRGVSDDGDSSVYSVDTDGYYTSMHTDSGLWCNPLSSQKPDGTADAVGFRQRQESQSSVSTIGNSSINSYLSKEATECSSNSGSLKRQPGPPPPPRVSSCRLGADTSRKEEVLKTDQDFEDSDKSSSPHPQNGSASESEHEVRDRIRLKTTISAQRYPSMCAVSPETSDDEIAELRNKTLKSNNVNVIVAEIHREDKANDDIKETDEENTGTFRRINKTEEQKIASVHDLNKNQMKSFNFPPSINMYRSETPLPSSFSTNIPKTIATSTPRSGVIVSSFSPDFSDTCSVARTDSSDGKSNCSEFDDVFSDDIIVTEKPSSSHSDKSLIPLKYAQRITVTPISRSDSSSSVTGTIKRTPLKQSSISHSVGSNLKTDKPNIKTPDKTDNVTSYVSFKAPDSPISSVPIFNKGSIGRLPSSPTSSLPRSIARVTLDPTGQVVYSSNSLGRSVSGSNKVNNNERTFATLPLCQNRGDLQSIKPLQDVQRTSGMNTKETINITNNLQNCSNSPPVSPSTSPSFVHPAAQNQPFSSFKSHPRNQDFNFRPSRGGRFCRSYFPSHLISPPSSSVCRNEQQSSNRSPADSNFQPKFQSPINSPTNCSAPNLMSNPHQSYSYNSAQQNYYSRSPQISTVNQSITNSASHINYVPNPRIQMTVTAKQFPSNSNANIWPGRISSYSSDSSISKFSPPVSTTLCDVSSTPKTNTQGFGKSLRPPDLIPSSESPPSTLDITSPASIQKDFLISNNQNQTCSDKSVTSLDKSNQPYSPSRSIKSMSATELFAIIHSSKKKHNIKSESELSMSPLSSRSVSPALSQSSSSKLQPIETGILSRRSDANLDRSKWCNSMPSNLSKRQLFQDKLGTTKPTSMHDFKMLLLQTRTGSHESSPRPSAAELLKVSPPKTSQNSPILKSFGGPTGSPSHSFKLQQQNSCVKSPTNYNLNTNYSPGHGTIPIKRNMRTRSPYLTRYDSAYPPILEDCSEEMESICEDKCLMPNSLPNKGQLHSRNTEIIPRCTTPVAKATSTWV
ncbi:actin remodeling regulator NHS-like [Uloborus diversus]|uniref:actin remodeling regulator NHS-like n=1 Tax=Uloborus diversus TaxID=327109 RepID=UPI0024094403|nr:actin remodeling regulator NHS-like [Uloborus diversus]